MSTMYHGLSSDNAIVISGMACRQPISDNVQEFKENLFNKVDMMTEIDETNIDPRIPKRIGYLKPYHKFDASFFGISIKVAEGLDPTCRLLLECTYEAILDAGMHPSEFEGSKTAVIAGLSTLETDFDLMRPDPKCEIIMSATANSIASRISYWLKANGRSFAADTACSSSMYALDAACRQLMDDQCEFAIVGTANTNISALSTLQFALLGVLSKDGSCKCFDEKADGYVRSASAAVFVLQKARTAKRIYAEVVHTKTNCDGYKEQGITYPSTEVQRDLMNAFYEECKISTSSVYYVEAHGTGTEVGDPAELNGIDQVFCTDRKHPLYIGSVKSNIGHSEPSAAIAAMIKMLIAFECGSMPPNMNYTSPRLCVKGLQTGRMIVVTEPLPLPKKNVLVAVNSFGFGGANGHTLLRRYEKLKINDGMPEDDVPRLVCISGRTEEGLGNILDDLQTRKLDAEYVALYHNIFRNRIPGHEERGYVILSKSGLISRSTALNIETENFYLLFGGENVHTSSGLSKLLHLSSFAQVLEQFETFVRTKGIIYDFKEIIEKPNRENIKHVVLSTIITQISIYETLKLLGVVPRDVFGILLGTLSSYLAKGKLSLDEVIEISFSFATLLDEALPSALHINDVQESKKINYIHSGLSRTVNELLAKRNSKISDTFARDLVENLLGCDAGIEYIRTYDEESIVVQCGQLSLITSWRRKIEFGEGCCEPLVDFLNVLGKLYILGHDMDLASIYPKINFPVSCGTPMISSLIKLRYSKRYKTKFGKTDHKHKEFQEYKINPNDIQWGFITGHVIDGRNLFPATGYLWLVWETFNKTIDVCVQFGNIIFENVKFVRAVNVQKSGHTTKLWVSILLDSGDFEVSEDDVTVVTGRIYKLDYNESESSPIPGFTDTADGILKEKDIYKELRLRGYNYSGIFRGLKECNVEATQAKVEWNDNWIAFLDNILQMAILQEDTRSLYVPTGIERISINETKHREIVESLNGNMLPVYYYKNCQVIRSGGVEINHLKAGSIVKRKQRAEAVLENYIFLPNEVNLTLRQSMRVNMQLILENVLTIKVKVFEWIDEKADANLEPLCTSILEALQDLPLIQPEIIVHSKTSLQIENINVQNDPLPTDESGLLIIGSNLLQHPESLEVALASTKSNGFILTREKANLPLRKTSKQVHIFTIHTVGEEKLVLLQKTSDWEAPMLVDISQSIDNFDWIQTAQKSLNISSHVVLYVQNKPTNGILGLVNCLRKEYSREIVRCVFLDDTAPKFDLKSPFYEKQLSKGLAINVYRNSQWGTYRHLLLEVGKKIESDHSYVNITTPGDLSSLTWVEGPIKMDNRKVVKIHYSALNFRDVMIASGRLAADVITRNRFEQLCLLGFEYAGVTLKGRRVMGMTNCGALSTVVELDPYLMWDIPKSWSMAEAATVPVVYLTTLYALILVGKMKRGESILIHSGTGGVGLAAINIALYYGCTIYTTVGTEEKRQFIRKEFPQIPETHVGNSRNTSFEQMISKETAGRGVDMVLNSLAEEKLQASIRCLAAAGRFLEIGKFDLASNNPLLLGAFKQGKTYHGIMLDNFFKKDSHVKKLLATLLVECIEKNVVKPLPKTIFTGGEIEQAFRYMATGKHIGKVLIKIKEDTTSSQSIDQPKCWPKFYCNPDHCQIIVGGLGGFGMELADWLILRGAKKLVLTSRKGITNGYQTFRISKWQNYGVEVLVATDDVTKASGCLNLIRNAETLGTVESIFNLAVVLRDKSFDNQTEEDFKISFAPKAFATQHLDEVTRKMCPNLKNFVIFSSVSCGRGNGGQTNYGMANSVMERICEQRRNIGLPGLAIQWGAVGDVGLVAETMNTDRELEIGGTLQQKITSCLDVLDVLIKQNNAAVVSSMVVAEKRKSDGDLDVISSVANILGINIKTVSLHASLPEMGMDSMMGVEIKQTLEREHNILLTAQEIRTLTFARLQEIVDEQQQLPSEETSNEKILKNVDVFMTFIEEEAKSKHPVVQLNTAEMILRASAVLFLPGIEGMSLIFDKLVPNLRMNAVCFQYPYQESSASAREMAQNILPLTYPYVSNEKPFKMVAYSFGCIVALELVHLLEEKGFKGKLILIDGAPVYLKKLAIDHLPAKSEDELQIALIVKILSNIFPLASLLPLQKQLFQFATIEEKIDCVLEYLPVHTKHSKAYQREMIIALHDRILAVRDYNPSFANMTSKMKLFKIQQGSVADEEEDACLSAISDQKMVVKYFNGNHLSVLENPELAAEINLEMEDVYSKSVYTEVDKIETRPGELRI